MSSARLLLLMSILAPSWADAQDEPSIDPFVEKSVVYSGGPYEDETFRYLFLAPPEVKPDERYPLVLFLHGAGERGDDNRATLRHLPENWAKPEFRKAFPCYLVVPQCRIDELWSPISWMSNSLDAEFTHQMKVALKVFHQTLEEHPIDRSRLYVTGLSMGGYGSWDLAMRRPDWFAGVAPVCGGGDETLAHRLVATPIWNTHGDADTAVPVERSRSLIQAIRRAGGLPRYTEIAGMGHNSWDQAYAFDGDVLPWLFSQRLKPIAERPLAGLQVLGGAHTPLQPNERIVFLGDSLTAAGVGEHGYITQLGDALKAQRPDLGVSLIGAGISGNKVPDIGARLDRDVLSFGPTAVFVFIGVNDVWHHQSGNGTSPDDFRAGLTDVILRIQNAGAAAILATPPVIGEKANGSNPMDAMLDDYAAISREVAGRFGVTVCDFRRLMPAYLSVFNLEQSENGILTTDGVHYNESGNRFVAHHVGLALYEALSRRQLD